MPRGLGGTHSDDERLAETSLQKLVEFLWYAVLGVVDSPDWRRALPQDSSTPRRREINFRGFD